ncbi:MAG: GNAT family N-acetyltransferase [Tannerellaceae bacterium]|nr:GNAT family N-acetyltransferase [Tannerellaceae bacterium]
MEIRKATPGDLIPVMTVYDRAREFMKQTGNANQWINGYPSQELILQTIDEGNCYICLHEQVIVGAFYLSREPDPTYAHIYEGSWLDDTPYGVVHRLASTGTCKGVADFCLQWCFEQCGNIRVDTHEDNKVMQHILTKHGYTRCGIIYVANGTLRIAFQKIKTPSVR